MHWGQIQADCEQAQKALPVNTGRDEAECAGLVVPKQEHKFACGKVVQDDGEMGRLADKLKVSEAVLPRSTSMPTLLGPDAQFIAKVWKESICGENSMKAEDLTVMGAKHGAESPNLERRVPMIRNEKATTMKIDAKIDETL